MLRFEPYLKLKIVWNISRLEIVTLTENMISVTVILQTLETITNWPKLYH